MATAAAGTSTPTKEHWDQLCRDVKSNLLAEMGEESWYLIIVSSLLAFSACSIPARARLVLLDLTEFDLAIPISCASSLLGRKAAGLHLH